jgi:hypothetical protein
MAALHNSYSAQSKDNVRRLKEVTGSGAIFFKAIESKVVFSWTKRGEVWWSTFISRFTTEEGGCTFPSS